MRFAAPTWQLVTGFCAGQSADVSNCLRWCVRRILLLHNGLILDIEGTALHNHNSTADPYVLLPMIFTHNRWQLTFQLIPCTSTPVSLQWKVTGKFAAPQSVFRTHPPINHFYMVCQWPVVVGFSDLFLGLELCLQLKPGWSLELGWQFSTTVVTRDDICLFTS